MSWILGLLGIPVLIKRISDLEERVEKQEREINRLRLIREGDMRILKETFSSLARYPGGRNFANRSHTDPQG